MSSGRQATCRLRRLLALGEGVGDAGAPVGGEPAIESGIIGLLAAGDMIDVGLRRRSGAHLEARPLPFLGGVDLKGESCIFRHRRPVSGLAIIIQID